MAPEGTARSGKAVGTRDRVVAWLSAHGNVNDPTGMASTVLSQHVGYPGSSVAFAQLLAGMERSGLIARHVRGRRTYRVDLTEAGRERAAGAPTGAAAVGVDTDRRADVDTDRRADVDMDALAHRLLRQVARRLAVTGELEAGGAARQNGNTPGTADPWEALDTRFASLEAELARVRSARLALQAENDELRGQLERIRSNLGLEVERPARTRVSLPPPVIDNQEIALLRKLLSPSGSGGRGTGRADTA